MDYTEEKLEELREVIGTCRASSDDRLVRMADLLSDALDCIEEMGDSSGGERMFLENTRSYRRTTIKRLMPRTLSDLKKMAKNGQGTGTLYEISPGKNPERTSLKKLGLK
jgi:5'-deoxynucleotidase YfbR-like HD superfamily hydrolase